MQSYISRMQKIEKPTWMQKQIKIRGKFFTSALSYRKLSEKINSIKQGPIVKMVKQQTEGSLVA